MLGFDTFWHVLAVFSAGLAAGAANAIAGGGSALSFPVLVFVGVPPVAANATSALGLWPGSLAAAWSYRSRMRQIRRRTLWLLAPALVGGLLGAWLLIQLPARSFAVLAPFLVMAAAASVGIAPAVKHWLGREQSDIGDVERQPDMGDVEQHPDMGDVGDLGGVGHPITRIWTGVVVTLGVAIYGGYFGAGMGLILLTTLGLLGLHDLQHANGVKNLMATVIKVPAILYFMAIGAARWDGAIVLAIGSISGGWLAGHLIQKVDTSRLRWVVALIGLSLGAFMLLR